MLQQHAATCRATYHPTGAPHGRDLPARRVAATFRQVCTDLNRIPEDIDGPGYIFFSRENLENVFNRCLAAVRHVFIVPQDP